MVVVAIMGTLASIAIPAFNEYRKTAKKSSYRVDLSSLHKSWLAFGVELDSFCDRESGDLPADRVASIKNVGMESLNGSKLYGGANPPNPSKHNFIGFGAEACPATTGLADVQIISASPVTTADTDCNLDIGNYEMGVFGHVSGRDYFGVFINHNGVLSAEVNPTLTAGQVSGAYTADLNCT